MLATFLLIIGVSFAVTASRLTTFVSDYLYEQRIRQDSVSVERLATTAAPLFQSAAIDRLGETLNAAAGEMGGRFLVLDRNGKVQHDTYLHLLGARLQLPEVIDILMGGKPSSYGIHRLTTADLSADNNTYVAYCSAPLISSEGVVGVLLFVSPVNEMIESLEQVRTQLLGVFWLVAAAALVLALFFSHLLTKPISSLTKTINRMGKGDLTVRVPVQGAGEFRQLAESYNTMAQQLEQLDQTRNQFVSNASHELKTPLTTMKVLLENILYQPDMPQELRDEFLHDLNHEIDRLTGIVTDLLTLTRMDSHRMEMHWQAVDLSLLCGETVHLLQPTAKGRGQLLSSRIQPNIVLQADSSKMGQILYNLTENALKYTPDEGSITVSLRRHGQNAIFSVEDTGVGIPAEDLPHIFDRFYRVDKARSRDTGGTGLGLSIVKQMVGLHGGTIHVDSTPGEGSLFTVELPITAPEEEKEELA